MSSRRDGGSGTPGRSWFRSRTCGWCTTPEPARSCCRRTRGTTPPRWSRGSTPWSWPAGADIEPSRYGAEPHPTTKTRPDRDAGELAVLRAALDADRPVLGVCRGLELLAVAYGGTLHQHLPDVLGNERHQPAPGVYGAHPARFVPGSRAAEIFGPAAEVNSYHHQAVDRPGALTVTGWADDEVVEAVEDPARRFVLGVQWHPEEAGDVRPFAALVRAI